MNCKNCLKYFNCENAKNEKPCCEFRPDSMPELGEWLEFNREIIGDTTER